VHVLLGLGEPHADQQAAALEEVHERAEQALAVRRLEAAGVAGLHDWTLSGPHLCMTRLNLLRLNTMPALDPAPLADLEKFRKDLARQRGASPARQRRIEAAASRSSGRKPTPPASNSSNSCRRIRGSQKALIWAAMPLTPSSCGFDSKKMAIWFAM
jgi:hypothetical protein